MITSWEMYWFTRLDGFHGAAIIMLVIGVVATVFLAAGYIASILDGDDDDDVRHRVIRPLLAMSILLVVVGAVAAILVPTTREMAAIKVVPMIANSESVKKLGDVGSNMLDLANEWLLELKPKKAK